MAKSALLEKLKTNKTIKETLVEQDAPQQFVSTDCYTLNLLFSGKLNGGIPIGKISSFAAPSATGKSFVGLKLAKNAQHDNDLDVIYVDTEFSYNPNFASNVGIDLDRFLPIQSNRIEEIQKAIASSVMALTKEERQKLLIIIDSWGGLITSKSMDDAISGNDKADFTPAKKKNALSRLLSGLDSTVFVVNHVYDNIGSMYDPLTIGGGKGLIFAASSIVLGKTKAKDKQGDEIKGSIISANAYKGRYAVENSKLKFLIKYEGGIHRYWGLLDDALEGGFVEKPNMGWYTRPAVTGDKKWREKEIWENSKEFWEPLLSNPDFHYFFEKKYSFEHNTIFSEDEMTSVVVPTTIQEEEAINETE